MFCLSASNKRIIASLLVVAFSSVFSRQILCVVIPHHEKEAVAEQHDASSSGTNDHHQGGTVATAPHHHTDEIVIVETAEDCDNTFAQSGEQLIPKEECCRQATVTVLSGMGQPPSADQNKKLQDVAFGQFLYHYLPTIQVWSVQKSIIANSLLRQVRPKIPDLRVFIGVFLI